jgi:hypothetical protein
MQAEEAKVLAELGRATGLAGRSRRATADPERAQVNVTRILLAIIGRITMAAPIAGVHLNASIRTRHAVPLPARTRRPGPLAHPTGKPPRPTALPAGPGKTVN